MEIRTKSAKKTKEMGFAIGKKILKKKGPIFLALEGDLGSGKTTFLQGLAKGMEIEECVNSPTFLIMKKYKSKKEKIFYHFDAYRINEKDLKKLDFDKLSKKENAVIAVEWSENVRKEIPINAIKINFSLINPAERKLIIKNDNGIMSDIKSPGTNS